LEVAIYNIDMVFCLFYLCFVDAIAMGFFAEPPREIHHKPKKPIAVASIKHK
jgi:hypothetical protein